MHDEDDQFLFGPDKPYVDDRPIEERVASLERKVALLCEFLVKRLCKDVETLQDRLDDEE